ncbi:SPOR domain-containing protein [Candidatus Latescibacterota bacterium]
MIYFPFETSSKGDNILIPSQPDIIPNSTNNERDISQSNGFGAPEILSSDSPVFESAGIGLIAQFTSDDERVPGFSSGGVDVLLTTPDIINIEPGKIITANFQVINTSGSSEDFNEKISLPLGWRLVIPRPESFTLGPSQQSAKLLTFLVPGKAVADTYQITYTAESMRDPGVSSSQEITVVVNTFVNVEILPLQVPKAVIGGEEYTAMLRMTNRGNSKTNIELSIQNRPNYDFSFNPKKVALAPGESENITIEVKTEDDANREISNVLTIQAEIEDGDNEKSTVVHSVKVKILPKISTEFDPYHRIDTDMKVTYAAERDGSGQQIEYSGKGNLDEDGKNKVNFQFRGPDIQDINPYGRREEYKLEYSYDKLINLNVGDRGYSLSPLTKMYSYGRGAEVGLEPGNVKFISHYVENKWNPDDKQVSSSLQYDFSETFLIKGNVFSQQLNATQYNNKIFSVQSSFSKYQLLNAEIEYAYNMNDTKKSSDSSYQVILNGRYGNRLSYDLNKTHADPQYYGYYKDIDYITGRVNLRLYKQIQARVNFRDYASNLDLDESKSTANRENFIKTGLTIPFSTSASVSVDYEHFVKKDILAPANYDFTEDTIILNSGIVFKSLNLRTGIEKGIYNNHLPGKGKLDRERYRANIIFRPTTTSYYSFSSNIGNYKYSVSNERSKSAGIKGNWKITENLTVDLNYWKYNFGLGKNRERDNIYSTIDYVSKRNHTISLRTYYSQYRTRRDRSVFLSYSIPLSVPTGKIKSVGILTGTIIDLEKEGNPPMPDVIVLLNGISAITNRRGEFVFSSLKPGKYFLRIDEKSIGLERIPTLKTPLEVSITGGRKVNHEIGIISSGKISGNVMLYAYGTKSETNPDSTEFSLNTIQGLSGGELGVAGGMENVLLELSNDTEIIRVLSEPSGSFSFNNLRPGIWSLKIYDDAIPMHHIIENSTRQIVLEPGGSNDIEVNVIPKQRQIKFLDQGSVTAVTVEAGSIPEASGAVRSKSDVVRPNVESVIPIAEKVSPVVETVEPLLPAGERPFTVQVLSSKLLQNALDTAELYRNRGYPAFYNLATVSGMGDWYRVYTGLYPTREDADGAAQNLISSGYISNPWVKEVDFEPDNSQITDSPVENVEETVLTPPGDTDADLQFTIQVSSHRDQESAMADVTAYRARGYNAFMEQASIDDIGTWYRVYAGRYRNRQEAVLAAEIISEKGLMKDPWVKNIQTPVEITSVPESILESVEEPVSEIDQQVEEQLPFTLQVASYQSQESAMNEVVMYLNRGYDASIRKTDVPGKGEWYRVYAGSFSTKKEAEDMARIFISEGYVSDPWIRDVGELPDEYTDGAELEIQESSASAGTETGFYYAIQVASYRDPENALNEVGLYDSRGYNSFRLLSSVPGVGDWYRVYVGRFNTQEEAQRISSILVRSGYVESPWIQRIELPINSSGN